MATLLWKDVKKIIVIANIIRLSFVLILSSLFIIITKATMKLFIIAVLSLSLWTICQYKMDNVSVQYKTEEVETVEKGFFKMHFSLSVDCVHVYLH